MSADVIPEILWPINETLSEFRTDCVYFEHRVASLLDGLERMRDQLQSQARSIEQQRHAMASREVQQMDELRQRLAEVQQDRDCLRSQLGRSMDELSQVTEELRSLREILQAHVGLSSEPVES